MNTQTTHLSQGVTLLKMPTFLLFTLLCIAHTLTPTLSAPTQGCGQICAQASDMSRCLRMACRKTAMGSVIRFGKRGEGDVEDSQDNIDAEDGGLSIPVIPNFRLHLPRKQQQRHHARQWLQQLFHRPTQNFITVDQSSPASNLNIEPAVGGDVTSAEELPGRLESSQWPSYSGNPYGRFSLSPEALSPGLGGWLTGGPAGDIFESDLDMNYPQRMREISIVNRNRLHRKLKSESDVRKESALIASAILDSLDALGVGDDSNLLEDSDDFGDSLSHSSLQTAYERAKSKLPSLQSTQVSRDPQMTSQHSDLGLSESVQQQRKRSRVEGLMRAARQRQSAHRRPSDVMKQIIRFG